MYFTQYSSIYEFTMKWTETQSVLNYCTGLGHKVFHKISTNGEMIN